MSAKSRHQFIIGVVGPCAAGKSTLINGLKSYGYDARHIAQEHSLVPEMWQIVTMPDFLIYLDVSYEQCIMRKPINLTCVEFEEEVRRLQHARQHANLYIHTDQLNAEQVLAKVLKYLQNQEMPQTKLSALEIE